MNAEPALFTWKWRMNQGMWLALVVLLLPCLTDARRVRTVVNADADAGTVAASELVAEYVYQAAGINGGEEAGSGVFDVSGFKPVKVVDARGGVTEFTYDALYRLMKEKRADGSVVHRTYNKAGQVTSVSDPAPAAWTPVPVAGTETGTQVLPQGGGGTDPSVTYTDYDALGRAVLTTYADGKSAQGFYTPSGAVWKAVDETGAETLSHYDALGRCVKVVQDKPVTGSANPETLMEYDAAGNAVKVTDARGHMTQTVYDVRNRPVAVIAPAVADYTDVTLTTMPTRQPVTLTGYDAAGRVIKVTDPHGRESRTFYDAAGRSVCRVDALDQKTLVTYDAGGNVTATTNALGQTTTNVYDKTGRLIKTTDAAGQANCFAYDKAGSRILVVDGREAGTTWTEATAYAWAAAWEGNPAAVPFSVYHTTFRYDAMNRLKDQTFANGDRWSYVYNRSGTLYQKTDPQGRVTTMSYDSRHRPDVSTGPTGSSLLSDKTYDAHGRLGSVADTSVQLLVTGTTTDTSGYTYDKLGRTVSETSYGRTHTYEYDLAGNRTEASLASHGSVLRVMTSTYDALNRLVSLHDNHRTAGTTDDRLITYGYDLCGRAMLMKTRSGTTNTSMTVNGYDEVGRLAFRYLVKGHDLATGNLLAYFSWTHDAAGNVTHQTEFWMKPNGVDVDRQRGTTMTYDAANRLKTESVADILATAYETLSTTYDYDGAGNRTGKTVLGSASGVETGYWTYTYNAANQLTRSEKRTTPTGAIVAAGSYTYAYDANGNRTSRIVDGTTAVAARTTTYAWDAWDRLRETGISTSATAKQYYRNTYDYRMRRIARAQTGGGLTTRHTAVTYSGGLSVAEFNRTGNTALAAGALAAKQYVRGPDMGGGVGGLLYSYTLNDTTQTLKFNLSNGRGDIVAQTSNVGAIVWTASYEAYGKQTKETGTNTDLQRANSKEEDPTGLLNEGYRYRDLDTGVWLSRDPAGFVDGPNLYAYVMQNPWSKFDPEGLALDTIWDVLNIVHDVGRLAKNGAEMAWGAGATGWHKAAGNTAAADSAWNGLDGDWGEFKQALGDTALDAGATLVPCLPAGIQKGVRTAANAYEKIEQAEAVVNTTEKLAEGDVVGAVNEAAGALPLPGKGPTASAKPNKKGVIYKVKGEKTPSGDPYIGRTTHPAGPPGRGSADGRDRTDAEVLDTYETTKEGKTKEQRGIDQAGGVDKLDNKRNEIAPEKRKEYGLDDG